MKYLFIFIPIVKHDFMWFLIYGYTFFIENMDYPRRGFIYVFSINNIGLFKIEIGNLYYLKPALSHYHHGHSGDTNMLK